jgi:molybdenum cofactor cytidylyltransferase
VVVADGEGLVAAAVHGYPAGIVVNPEPEGDMASSVRAGRNGVPEEVCGVIVSLCDYPLVSSATISALIQAHRETPACIIIPCHQGRRGHPLLFPRAVLGELGEGEILRDLVRREPERIRCLDVNDHGVLLDMDTPDDYRRICEMMP